MVAYSFGDMRVRVLYFGVLKEIFGRENEMLEMAEGVDVAGLLAICRGRGRAPLSLWDSLAVAVNQEYARGGRVLRDGDEVALLPPVSGGVWIGRHPPGAKAPELRDWKGDPRLKPWGTYKQRQEHLQVLRLRNSQMCELLRSE